MTDRDHGMGGAGSGGRGAGRWIGRGFWLLAAACAVWALRSVEPSQVLSRLGAARWGVILGLSAAATALTFLPTWIFLRRAGARVPFLGLSAVLLASQAVNAVNPMRMGFPMRVYLLKERYRVPATTSSLLIPLEGFVAVAVAVLAAVIAAPIQATALRSAPGALLALGVLGGAFAAVAAGRIAARHPQVILTRLPDRARALMGPLMAAISHVRPPMLAVFAICFLLADLAVAQMLGVALRASGFEAPVIFLLGAYCAAYLLGILSLIPQGLGSRDAALGFLLHAGGATADQAAAAVLVARVGTTGLTFASGLLSALILGLTRGAPRLGAGKTAPSGAPR